MERKYTQIDRGLRKYPISEILIALEREIEKTEKLFVHIDSFSDPDNYDHYNKYRILLPILEVTSKIEFNNKGDDSLLSLLNYLSVPEPEFVLYMYRHGLLHSIFPFFVDIDGVRKSFGIPFGKNSEHFEHPQFLAISSEKLLKDLKKYLDTLRLSSDLGKEIDIQISISLKKRAN